MDAMAHLTVPPESIETGTLVLRRLTPEDAPAVSRAVTESLDHLRPWMPWATPEAATVAAQRARLEGPAGAWEPDGSEYAFGMFLAADGTLVGGIGLHRRLGPRALEIGYWVHVAHTGRGYATNAAGAVTEAVFALAATERLEIHCDASNRASAAVPVKLGYRLLRTDDREPQALGETGRHQVWALSRDEWIRRTEATGGAHPAG